MTRLILVRHGQTDWNVKERFRGRFDVPLNETGVRQALLTTRRISSAWKPAAVYSSPLSRALSTARAIAEPLSLPVRELPEMIDMNFGQWEGLSPDEVRARWPELLAAWYSAPHTVRMPGGESLHHVRSRCERALEIIEKDHPERTVVAVAHTDFNRTMLLVVLGLGNDRLWHLRQDTCAINEIEMENGDFTLVSMNETSHLTEDSPPSS
ncbi:MAG TPA: histidine phosphatase family protein [Spirochaetia bacterium]|nr:histidine phosphatase family protein [Spirochaetia bacterium]